MQLRKLTVYGRLRQFLGQSHFEVAVNNPRQAFAFLIANFPEVENHMTNQLYKVKMGDTEITENLLNLTGDGDIKIIPIAIGAKKVGKILGGVALVGLSVATGGFGGAAIGTFGLGAGSVAVGTIATSIGASMIIGGVTEMIMPVPEMPSFNASDMFNENDPYANMNFGFSAITNNTRAGVPVPIIYGEVFTGSIVISSGIDTAQIEGTA
tara:strand:+ start:3357 stop:3986 length:630 start_codon:yes stop_codon:yes gene_type:complete